MSPYGYYQSAWSSPRPRPNYHAQSIHQTIALNNSLNTEAQAKIDAKEPNVDIWDDGVLERKMSELKVAPTDDKKRLSKVSEKGPLNEARQSVSSLSPNGNSDRPAKQSRLSSFRKSIGIK